MAKASEYRDPPTSRKALTNFIAGAIGGAGSTSLIHPLDSLKVKMQTFPHLYSSGVQCAREVTRQDGLRGLYRGLTPGVTLSMTEASIRYMTYGVCQDIVKAIIRVRSSESMTLFHNALAGGLTGFVSTLASCPIELVKCRTQGMLEIVTKTNSGTAVAANNALRNPGAVAVHVVRTEGLRGLYRGFVSNASRNTPGEMVFFATYEQARYFIKQSGQVKDDIGALGSFVCGSCAGVSYWVSIYPLDSVKSRVQVLSAQGKVAGLWQTFWDILTTEGFRRLYHGVAYSIPRAILGSGSHFVFYETTRRILLRDHRSNVSQ